MKTSVLASTLCGLAVLACPLPAHALALAITAADQGNVSRLSSTGTPAVIRHTTFDTNVSAAELSLAGSSVTTRGYAWFAIPDGLPDAASVTLKAFVAPLGSGPVSFSLVSIERPFGDFQVGYAEVPSPEGEALLEDLRDGDLYHGPVSIPVGGSLPGGSFALSASAVAALNAARGGWFGIGFTGGGTAARIEFFNPVLEVAVVPEPASWMLGMLGLLSLGLPGFGRKKRSA